MKTFQSIGDKAAISLSLLCTIQCLALPLVVIWLPSLATLTLDEEAFHLGMLAVVVPISLYALTMGCKKHQFYRLLFVGGAGLAILCGTAIWGHDLLGETGEKALTVIGAGIITVAHVWNYRLCRQPENCECGASH